MMRWLLIFIYLSILPAAADVFKQEDQKIVSQFPNPYTYQRETVKQRVSGQIDLERSTSHQIKNPMGRLELNELMAKVSNSGLMMWQYSSPAAADLLKHYQTIATLNLGMAFADLKGLEHNLNGDLDGFKDQSRMDCIEKKIASGAFEGDLVDILSSCRQTTSANGAFAHLNFSRGQSFHIFEKIINKLNVRGEQKEAVLSILPIWTIEPDGYQLKGPAKRIGHVLAEKRQLFKEQMNEALDEYRNERAVSSETLGNFAVAGAILEERHIKNLLTLKPSQSEVMIDEMVEQMAWGATLDQYELAMEFLRRAINHPSIEKPYKEASRLAMDYMSKEQESLMAKYNGINRYTHVVDALAEASYQEGLDTLARQAKELRGQEIQSKIRWSMP